MARQPLIDGGASPPLADQQHVEAARAMRAEHVIQTYNKRLDFFRHMRRKVDPENRLLSPFMAQFMQ